MHHSVARDRQSERSQRAMSNACSSFGLWTLCAYHRPSPVDAQEVQNQDGPRPTHNLCQSPRPPAQQGECTLGPRRSGWPGGDDPRARHPAAPGRDARRGCLPHRLRQSPARCGHRGGTGSRALPGAGRRKSSGCRGAAGVGELAAAGPERPRQKPRLRGPVGAHRRARRGPGRSHGQHGAHLGPLSAPDPALPAPAPAQPRGAAAYRPGRAGGHPRPAPGRYRARRPPGIHCPARG